MGEGLIGTVTDGFFTGSVAGVFVGSVKAAWASKPVMKSQTTTILSYTASTIGKSTIYFGFLGGVYAGTKKVSEMSRAKDDYVNKVNAATVLGAVVGASRQSVALTVGLGVTFGSGMALYQIFGDKLFSDRWRKPSYAAPSHH
eukprot:Colp12_sorted_trinity150504_noHs@15142